MQVLETRPGRASAIGRNGICEIDTRLVGEVSPGDWVLVFIDSARELIDEVRAREVNGVLDLLQGALVGQPLPDAIGFELPSARSAADLQALFGGTGRPETP